MLWMRIDGDTNANKYPTDGRGGASETAGASLFANAANRKLRLFKIVHVIPNINDEVDLTIRDHDGTAYTGLVLTVAAAETLGALDEGVYAGPREIPFGPDGIVLTNGVCFSWEVSGGAQEATAFFDFA